MDALLQNLLWRVRYNAEELLRRVVYATGGDIRDYVRLQESYGGALDVESELTLIDALLDAAHKRLSVLLEQDVGCGDDESRGVVFYER